MDTRAHADTRTQKIYSCKKKKKEEKKGRNNNCEDANLARKINSIRKFSDTNLGIKKNHNLIKTVTTI